MANRSSALWPAVTAIVGALVLVLALPQRYRAWAPSFLSQPDFHLGLDLAGGTQLDFRISEDEIAQELADIDAQLAQARDSGNQTLVSELELQKQVIEQQRSTLMEAIRNVLEKRINSLGVSEATITPSYVGDEKHLLIDCPGVVDVEQCIETVGKTIQLEFKEQQIEASAEYEGTVRARANAAYGALGKSGATLATTGQDLGDELGIGYQEGAWVFRGQLPKGLESLWTAPKGTLVKAEGSVDCAAFETLPVSTVREFCVDEQGGLRAATVPGVFMAQSLSAQTSTGRVLNEAPAAFQKLQSDEQGLAYSTASDAKLDATVPAAMVGALKAMQPGELKTVALTDGTARVLFLRGRTPGREEVDVSHIVVSYKDAASAPATVTRTKEEALVRATEIKKQLDGGANFEEVARAQSDAQTSKAVGGKVGPIARNTFGPSFDEVAFSAAAGSVSVPVETEFGYHIIRVNAAPATTPDVASYDSLAVTGTGSVERADALLARLQAGEVKTMEPAVRLSYVFFSLAPTGWKDTELDGSHFRTAAAALDPTTSRPIVQITFDPEGARLFQELTKRNIGKPIAIFVGGQLVSAPTVQGEISGGTAVITGSQTIAEAQSLSRDLNTGAIPAPIHLSGQHTVEATLGADALRSSLYAALVGIALLMAFMLVMYRFLGVIANIALVIYALIFLALLKLPLLLVTNQYVVLTLAGAAGMILSIGMAVDTNVLVFERVKEELKRGRTLKSAVETGFNRAWSSIRDSNISTLITCGILFIIGTSIVRGFAVTLALGVLISMFTGMTIARWIARKVAGSPLAKSPALFPGMQAEAVRE